MERNNELQPETYEYQPRSYHKNADEALRFVYNHRNIFSDSTRRYVELEHAEDENEDSFVIIRETDRKGTERQWWFWCFFKDHYNIFKFNTRPTREDVLNVISECHKQAKKEMM